MVLGSLAATPALASSPLTAPDVSSSPRPTGNGPCTAWDVTFSLAAKLRVSDTPLGAGDGIYTIGPGEVVLRFDNVSGQPSGSVRMLGYRMKDHFTVTTKTLFITTRVITRTETRVTPDRCGSAAEGAVAGDVLQWTSKVRGYRTDGTLTCEGPLCGKFGAPPSGTSQLHIGPGSVAFQSFKFNEDRSTFTMGYALVSKTATPKQTAHVTLAGRQISRRCVSTPPCR